MAKAFVRAALWSLFALGSAQTNVFITEIADPNNSANSRFVELYSPCGGPLNGMRLVRWTNDYSSYTSTTSYDLSAITMSPGSFLILCKSKSTFETTFAGKTCDVELGNGGPGDSNGDDHIALIDLTDNIIDIFGIPGVDGTNQDHEFEDGRAERKAGVTQANPVWDFSEWNVDNDGGDGDGPQTAPDDYDPASWIGASQATCSTSPATSPPSASPPPAEVAKINVGGCTLEVSTAMPGKLVSSCSLMENSTEILAEITELKHLVGDLTSKLSETSKFVGYHPPESPPLPPPPLTPPLPPPPSPQPESPSPPSAPAGSDSGHRLMNAYRTVCGVNKNTPQDELTCIGSNGADVQRWAAGTPIKHVSGQYPVKFCVVSANDNLYCEDSFDANSQMGSPIDLGGGVESAAVGYTAKCAILMTGQVKCWGDGYSGYETIDLGGDTPTRLIADDSRGKFCAMVEGGNCASKLTCWTGSTTATCHDLNFDGSFKSFSGSASGLTVVDAEGGWNHMCALLSNGGLGCEGSNTHGSCEPPSTIGTDAVSVHVYSYSTCVVKPTGRPVCWGNSGNYNGLDSIRDEAPTTLTSHGYSACAGYADGTVECFGNEANSGNWGSLGGSGYQIRD